MKTLTLTNEEFAVLRAMNSFWVNNVAEEDTIEMLRSVVAPTEENDELGYEKCAEVWSGIGEKLV